MHSPQVGRFVPAQPLTETVMRLPAGTRLSCERPAHPLSRMEPEPFTSIWMDEGQAAVEVGNGQGVAVTVGTGVRVGVGPVDVAVGVGVGVGSGLHDA